MCECGCEKPEKLKGEPHECSSEQIKECHGSEINHPCVESAQKKEGEENHGKKNEG